MVTIAVVAGDGIGPEITEATLHVLAATGVNVDTVSLHAGDAAIDAVGDPLPEDLIQTIRELGLALKGPLFSPASTGPISKVIDGQAINHPSVNPALRLALGLFANVRPVRSYHPAASGRVPMDIVIVRETTEGAYSGIGHHIDALAGESVRLITAAGSERIMRFAFEYARRNSRRRVTLGHKANVLPHTDGLMLRVAEHVAADYSDIDFNDLRIDALAALLVRDPARLDVVVLENQYGDIISDVAAELAGSLGLAPGANYGDGVAVFEASHGAAPDIAGMKMANPLALILSAAMLLDHIGESQAGQRVRDAVAHLLATDGPRTPDLGGDDTTMTVAEAVATRL